MVLLDQLRNMNPFMYFEDEANINLCPDHFVIPPVGPINRWISNAKNACYNYRTEYFKQKETNPRFMEVDDDESESGDSRDSMYSKQRVSSPVSSDVTAIDIDNFIRALPTCYPLFGHIHNPDIARYKTKNCWCPCSKELSPWRKHNNINLSASRQCTMTNVVSNDLITHLMKTKCIYHRLARLYLQSYYKIFKGKHSLYLSLNPTSNVESFPETDIPPNYSKVSSIVDRRTTAKSNVSASNGDWPRNQQNSWGNDPNPIVSRHNDNATG